MKRYAMVIGLRAEKLEEYKRLHAAVWPDVLDTEWSANWLSFERSELPLPPWQAVACT